MTSLFPPVRPVDGVAMNILRKRYFHPGETAWEQVARRVVDFVMGDDPLSGELYDMIANRYFIPNSPTLFNAGLPGAGLSACFVVGMEDNIDSIMKTFSDFVHICRKGGGAGVSLSSLRPEGDPVAGSSHGYAGGPIKFYDALCKLMEVMAQSGKRAMAQLGAMSARHPDIMKFIKAKEQEGRMTTTNISVVVDDDFMRAVENDETYWTEFGGKKYQELRARDVFDAIVDGAWRNGEPGLLFDEKMNKSPFVYSGQKLNATNPCFTGDMLLLTEDGYRTFSELAGKSVMVVNHKGNVVEGGVWSTGEKPVVKVRLSNGAVIRCTDNHLFMTVSGDSITAANAKGEKLMPYLANTVMRDVPYVTSVVPDGVEDVFDFSEPETHWGVVNGFIAHNCGEVPTPPNGVCTLGSFDLTKFMYDGHMVHTLLGYSARLAARFLDKVIDVNSFPTPEIAQWAADNRPIGIGVMGFADYLLEKGIAYGSPESLDEIESIMLAIYTAARLESEQMGREKGIPKSCQCLPEPRRNVTLLSIAPTGTISLIAGTSSGIEPIFSELTVRTDNTGTYDIHHPLFEAPHFRCAVSANGAAEVTWQEHVAVQNAAQRYVDSGVSKTINLPQHAQRSTVYNAFMQAWKSPYIKGLTIYRNQSRTQEVLTPKNVKHDKCPVCGGDLIKEAGCKHCSKCDFAVCTLG